MPLPGPRKGPGFGIGGRMEPEIEECWQCMKAKSADGHRQHEKFNQLQDAVDRATTPDERLDALLAREKFIRSYQ